MIILEPDIKIYIYHQQVDMRKAIDGLVYFVTSKMNLKPHEKSLFIFRNKLGDKFKALIWDKDGFILIYKRMEKGRFKFP